MIRSKEKSSATYLFVLLLPYECDRHSGQIWLQKSYVISAIFRRQFTLKNVLWLLADEKWQLVKTDLTIRFDSNPMGATETPLIFHI
ncbi:hypothetical protein TNCT_725971 [Trichonephila clavata]|uniref:Uncharacterized protein n=1 Tax=Trichonephila clavata TaxID=2740835 RepID=A0A8X6GCZ3_TRICU|nr:hypothetical protein TNCT_725971 [Trichonephila clavata]